MFVGRENEFQLLNGLFDLKKAAIALCVGRRRIGKSTLIQKFGKSAKAFLEFQGLPPREVYEFDSILYDNVPWTP